MDEKHATAIHAVLSDVHEDLVAANTALANADIGMTVLLVDRIIRELQLTKEWLMFHHRHAEPKLPKEAGQDGD